MPPRIPQGDFSFVKDDLSRTTLQKTYDAITELGLWTFLETATPPANTGFMFWNPPELACLEKHPAMQHHSGASYGWAMRNMELIAQHGWDVFVYEWRRHN